MRRRPSFSLKQEWLIERIVRRKPKEKEEEKRQTEEEVVSFLPVVYEPKQQVSLYVEEAPIDDNYPQGSLVFYDGFLWYRGSSGWVRGVMVTVASSFPPTAYVGDICYRSDENQFYVYNGTNWQREASIKSGTTFPTTHQFGDIFFKTDENRFYISDGTAWKREPSTFIATSFPSSPQYGDICYRSDEGKFYIYNGSTWLVESTGSGGGGGVGVGFGTSFPSSPSNGDLFYRTDLKRLYAYNGNTSQWVAQEAIQISAPDSPVTGEVWLENSSNRIAVVGSSSTNYIGFLQVTTPDVNTVSGSGGTLTAGAAAADRRGRLAAGLDAEFSTLSTDKAIGVYQSVGVAFLNTFYVGGSGNRFLEIPANHFMQPTLLDKSVSSGNNDIVKADHPTLYVEGLNYQVLASESAQVDFYGYYVTKHFYQVGTPALNYLRGYIYVFLRGQASFTYQLAWQLEIVDVYSGSVITTSSEANFSIATNDSGIGSTTITVGALVGSNTNRQVIVKLRLKRRRSAESVGSLPDNCYIACAFTCLNWNS